MASSFTMGVLTAEPAVVVPTIYETEMNQMQQSVGPDSPMQDFSIADISRHDSMHRSSNQYGATLRRAATTVVSPQYVSHPSLSEVQVQIEAEHRDIEMQEMNQDSETGHVDYYDCVSEELSKCK